MKHFFSLFFLLTPLYVMSQSLAVASFEMNPHDLTAINEATKEIDDNGEVAALIKIETTQKGFVFDGGTIGVVKVDDSQVGEIWLYVPAGLLRITIKHPQLGVLRDYYFPERLQSARTYIMKLITGTVEQVVNQKRTSQVFVLTFTPKDAMVEIDGTMVETDDGSYSGVLPFGKHQYRISSKDYHTEVGFVEIGEQKVVKDIALNPAFGWIEVKGPNGASVYIDGKKVGVAPMKSDPVASGSHDVRVMRDKYLPYREQVLVNDNTTTTITPSLTANFTTVNLKTTGDAEIWVNGEKVGNGSVSVDLVPGEYSFETKKASHRSQSIVRNITMSSGGTIDLPAPVAIFGSIMVNVKPVGAKVIIDGKSVGETPVILDDVLVGQHDLLVTKAGCTDRSEIVTVTEGQISTLEGRLVENQRQEVKTNTEIVQPKLNDTPKNCFAPHFEGSFDFNSNFTKSHGGVGADVVLGYRLKEYYHIGGGLGFHSMLNTNIKDYNLFATLYFNNTFYIPARGKVLPMFELAVGGDIGFLRIPGSSKYFSYGLYSKAGIGFETDIIRMSVGYELLGTSTGYVKLGFKF